MPLLFEQKNIPSHLTRELGLQEFLSYFDLGYGLLSHHILKPLSPSAGENHFNDLAQLEAELSTLPSTKIFARAKLIGDPLPSFSLSQIEQHHLFQIGNYIDNNLFLIDLEKKSAIEGRELLSNIREKILKVTTKDYSELKNNDRTKDDQSKLYSLKKNLSKEITLLEKRIEDETGIKMIYPYPREIENSQSIPKCSFLSVEKKNKHILLSYRPHPEMSEALNAKNAIEKNLSDHYRTILDELWKELKPLISALCNYHAQRTKRVLQYCILEAKQKHNLCIPTFEQDFKIQEAVLPSLANTAGSDYRPLDLSLKKGPSIIFGANMTGKTTVLKTVYFHLILTKFGLPTPANNISLPFPERVSILLRSSGSTERNLSSFGEEINFFCQHFSDGEYLLVDELFHSTNPTSGIELSKIFIDEFKNRDLIFLCNSHYKEILDCEDVALLRMKDAELTTKEDNLIEDLLKSIPYQVETITDCSYTKDDVRPLEIALHFPLQKEIKDRIIKRLRNVKS